MKHLLLITFPICLFFAACSATPTKRIQKNPTLFSKLSPEHQKLVRDGKIAQGMNKSAVFLAMGEPDSKTSGIQNGKAFEIWNYNVLVPVYHGGFHPYYGGGYGRFGLGYGYCGRRGGYYSVYYQPSVHYEPRHGASIKFRNNRVTDWSQRRYNF